MYMSYNIYRLSERQSLISLTTVNVLIRTISKSGVSIEAEIRSKFQSISRVEGGSLRLQVISDKRIWRNRDRIRAQRTSRAATLCSPLSLARIFGGVKSLESDNERGVLTARRCTSSQPDGRRLQLLVVAELGAAAEIRCRDFGQSQRTLHPTEGSVPSEPSPPPRAPPHPRGPPPPSLPATPGQYPACDSLATTLGSVSPGLHRG